MTGSILTVAKINVKDKNCRYQIMSRLLSLIENDCLPPVILCIGSQRIAGDILGPLVGDMLVNQYNTKAYVYGTLNRPVTAVNITKVHDFIKKFHPGGKILAIDAALGSDSARGIINIYKGGVLPGAAIDKALPPIGDYSITANVNVFGRENIVQLAKTKFGDVFDLAQNIAFGINDMLSIKRGIKLYA